MPSLFAYLDPATGAIVLQIILAGILGIGFVFRRLFITPFTFLLNRRRNRVDSESVESGE